MVNLPTKFQTGSQKNRIKKKTLESSVNTADYLVKNELNWPE